MEEINTNPFNPGKSLDLESEPLNKQKKFVDPKSKPNKATHRKKKHETNPTLAMWKPPHLDNPSLFICHFIIVYFNKFNLKKQKKEVEFFG